MRSRTMLTLILAVTVIGCHEGPESSLETETSSSTGSEATSSGTSSADEDSTSTAPIGDSTDTAAAGSSTGAATGEDGERVDTTGGGTWIVSGVVTRSVEPSAGSDGVGNVDIGLFVRPCGPGLSEADEAAVFRLENVDITAADVEVPFVFDPAVPNGTYWVAGVFDDNTNLADTPGHAADSGDLVTTACPMVVVDGADVSDVALELDLVIP